MMRRFVLHRARRACDRAAELFHLARVLAERGDLCGAGILRSYAEGRARIALDRLAAAEPYLSAD